MYLCVLEQDKNLNASVITCQIPEVICASVSKFDYNQSGYSPGLLLTSSTLCLGSYYSLRVLYAFNLSSVKMTNEQSLRQTWTLSLELTKAYLMWILNPNKWLDNSCSLSLFKEFVKFEDLKIVAEANWHSHFIFGPKGSVTWTSITKEKQ